METGHLLTSVPNGKRGQSGTRGHISMHWCHHFYATSYHLLELSYNKLPIKFGVFCRLPLNFFQEHRKSIYSWLFWWEIKRGGISRLFQSIILGKLQPGLSKVLPGRFDKSSGERHCGWWCKLGPLSVCNQQSAPQDYSPSPSGHHIPALSFVFAQLDPTPSPQHQHTIKWRPFAMSVYLHSRYTNFVPAWYNATKRQREEVVRWKRSAHISR